MELKVGSIVQLSPQGASNLAFFGTFLVVTEIKSWGVVGYVQALGTRDEVGGRAYCRVSTGTFENTGGTVVWEYGD